MSAVTLLPLDGLPELSRRAAAPVLIVGDSKSAVAAGQLLPAYVVVTWRGWGEGIDLTDWSPLAGRNVVIWPDADATGWHIAERLEAILRSIVVRLRVLDTTGRPKGWAAAEAIIEKWDSPKTIAWARSVIRESMVEAPRVDAPRVEAPAPPPLPPSPPATIAAVIEQRIAEASDEEIDHAIDAAMDLEPPAPEPPKPARTKRRGNLTLATGGAEPVPPPTERTEFLSWTDLGLTTSGNGLPHANLNNCVRVLEVHPEMAGRFWFDEFHQKVFHKLGDTPAEVTDGDVLLATRWIQRTVAMPSVDDSLMTKAIRHAAMGCLKSEPRDWMDSLQWDGTPRLWQFLHTHLGTPHTPYHTAVGRNVLRSMVARIYRPGCKVDTMPVLEGKQGTFKSTAAAILGGPWYCVMHESVMSKDFFQVLQGKLLVEIAEMDSFSRAEIAKVKSVLDTRVDRFRTPYGRLAEDRPRRNIFIGTTNEDSYLRDVTGARRFWPIRCGRIDVDALHRDRAQLFAEAVAEYKAGEPWWMMPGDETEEQQESRRSRDEWESIVRHYVDEELMQPAPDQSAIWVPRDVPLSQVQMSDMLREIIGHSRGWNRADQMRIASCFKILGWERVKHAADNQWWYHRPASNGSHPTVVRPEQPALDGLTDSVP